MKKITSVLLVGISIVAFAFQSCESEEKENDNEKMVSSYNEEESHNAGMNCMNCHSSDGDGEGWFHVAGSVFNEGQTEAYPNATVEFYTGQNGQGSLKYSVEVDGKGNFYTTEDVEFGEGLYVSVKGSESTQYMMTPVTSGACSICHGNSTDPIWTK